MSKTTSNAIKMAFDDDDYASFIRLVNDWFDVMNRSDHILYLALPSANSHAQLFLALYL